MADLAIMLGGLVPTFLVSRLFLRFLKRWGTGIPQMLAANTLSLGVACLIAGWAMADPGHWKASAGILYVVPQTIWLVVDLLRHRKTSSENSTRRAA